MNNRASGVWPARFTPNTPDEAIEKVIEQAPILPRIICSDLAAAHGLICAQDIITDRPSPPFTCSSMDGYAVRVRDITLLSHQAAVVADSRIGIPPPLVPDDMIGVVRIVTGAPLPAGFDAVVKVEDTSGDVNITFQPGVLERCKAGQAVRRVGENAPAGTLITTNGREFTAALIAAAAAFGCTTVMAYAPIRIAIITTGDELVPADSRPQQYQIRNSSAPALRALFSRRSWLACGSMIHIPDDDNIIASTLQSIITSQSADCIILTGGVSMGHHDFVPGVVHEIGAKMLFHTLPQRPGKPMLAAMHSSGPLIFGLPGNPQSTLITARRIVLPILAHCAGFVTEYKPSLSQSVNIAKHDGASLGLWWYRPVFKHDSQIQLNSDHGSGDIPSLAASTGFIEQPPGTSSLDLHRYFGWDW